LSRSVSSRVHVTHGARAPVLLTRRDDR
jgi:hypothetical protein